MHSLPTRRAHCCTDQSVLRSTAHGVREACVQQQGPDTHANKSDVEIDLVPFRPQELVWRDNPTPGSLSDSWFNDVHEAAAQRAAQEEAAQQQQQARARHSQ